MATITHFRDLHAWQQCREIRLSVRRLVRAWPEEEKYKLTDQIIRSSRGPTAHLAEGDGRFYERENIRFCRIAKGSLYETQDHLITAQDEGYLSGNEFTELFDMVERAITVLNGYVRYLDGLKGGRSIVSEPVAAYATTFQSLPEPPSPENPLVADL